ncbi:MAG: hypothetical protein ACK4YP_11150, partial [Myxococcota bacterium]
APREPGVRGRVWAGTHWWATEAWVRAAATGRLEPPYALAGELPNGTGALDRVVVVGEGDLGGLATLGVPVARVVGERITGL